MNQTKKMLVALFALGSFLVLPLATHAIDGVNMDDIKVKVYAKQGGDWFRALTQRADDDGVLKFKNALPGWYKMELEDDDDAESTQYLAIEVRMTDVKGRKLKEDTDVDMYIKVGDTDVFIATLETDEKGWLKVEGLSLDTEYKLDISDKDTSHVSKKDNCVRIKTKAKIDDSDWFYANYDKTDENKVLESKNVLPGKYKFKYKTDDQVETEPFTLKLRLRNEDGEKIKEATDVELYAYINKQRVLVGEMQTDAKGWIMVPGVMTNMKYKIKVDD